MLDNQLIAAVRDVILERAASAGIPGIAVKQAFQPTQQGPESGPSANFYKVGPDRRLGSPARADRWDAELQQMKHTETQQYETTFQLSVLATQDPARPQDHTPGDIANLIAYILQSDAGLVALREKGIGILRITDVRNPFFEDDSARHQANPGFDFTLTHKQIVTTINGIITGIDIEIYSV